MADNFLNSQLQNSEAPAESSGLETFVNNIPGYAKDVALNSPLGIAYQGAKAAAEALPQPTKPGVYQSAVAPVKNLVATEAPAAPPPTTASPSFEETSGKNDFIPAAAQSSPNATNTLDQQLNDIQKQFTGAVDQQATAKNAFTDALSKQAAAEFEQSKLQDQAASALAEQQQKQRDAQLNEQKQAQDAYESAVTDFEKQGPPDPKRYWSRAGTGEKVLAGIALLFGAAAQAYGSRENPGINAINDAIDKDIKMQTSAIEQKKDTAGMKQGILNQMYRKFDNMQTAQAAAKLAMTEAAQRQMNQIAGQFASPKIKAQAAENNATFNEQKAKIALQFAQAKSALKPGAITSAPIGQRIDRETADKLDPKLQEKLMILPDGSMAPAISNEAATEYRKYTSSVNPAISGIDRIIKLSENYNRLAGAIPGSEAAKTKRKIESEIQGVIGNLRIPYTGPGILSGPEFDRLKGIVGDPTSYFRLPEVERASLNQIKAKMVNDIYDQAKGAGLRDTAPSFKPGASPIRK